jgi:hypothetical protein
VSSFLRYNVSLPRIRHALILQDILNFTHTLPYRPWNPPSLLYNVYRSFPGSKPAGAWRWPPTHPAPRLKKMGRFIPLLPLWVFMAFSMVNFYLLISLYLHFILNIYVYLYVWRNSQNGQRFCSPNCINSSVFVMNTSNLLKVEVECLCSIVYMNIRLQNVCVKVVLKNLSFF